MEATYTGPTQHGSIGPSCALAELKDGKLTVWSHTQGVFPLRSTSPRRSGCRLRRSAVSIPKDPAATATMALTMFARRGMLARATDGKPVRLQWMRDDEFMWEPYGPAMTMRSARPSPMVASSIGITTSGVKGHNMRPGDPDGINLLAAGIWPIPGNPAPARQAAQPSGAGDRNAVPLYDFPRQRITHHLIDENPIRTSALRTLGAYANVFAVKSFMDELAAAAGVDPVAFRLAHLKDPRSRAVIEAAAKAADWKPGEKGDGKRGRGFAFARYKSTATFVAAVVDIEIDRDSGLVRVPRAWAAVDAGQIINPNGLINQIEGGIVQSTSWTLHEQVRYDKSGILAHDWDLSRS